MQVANQTIGRNKIHPYKFALWVGIGSICMMFAAMTSAYVVRRAAGNWLEFRLPLIFLLNIITVVASSLSLQYSYNSFLKGHERGYKMAMIAAFILGLVFVLLQYQGWLELNAIGATFTANPSSSFIYVISGLHAAHVLGGIACLVVALAHAYALPFKPTEMRKLRFQLVLTYWHFVGILWIYLVSFLMLQA